jgi:hypothetical protein
MRQTDDSLNAVAGGALAGAALGMNGMRWINVLTRRPKRMMAVRQEFFGLRALGLLYAKTAPCLGLALSNKAHCQQVNHMPFCFAPSRRSAERGRGCCGHLVYGGGGRGD